LGVVSYSLGTFETQKDCVGLKNEGKVVTGKEAIGITEKPSMSLTSILCVGMWGGQGSRTFV
jgi:hypothetical protein